MYYIRGDHDAWLKKPLRDELVKALIHGVGKHLFVFDNHKSLLLIADLNSPKYNGTSCLTYDHWADYIQELIDRYSLPVA